MGVLAVNSTADEAVVESMSLLGFLEGKDHMSGR